MIAVTDTHALLWAATGKLKKLGKAARRYYERADRGTGNIAIYIPAIALVEVAEAVEAGRVTLSHPFPHWVRLLFALGPFVSADLTVEVILAADDLQDIPERGDRLIAATALVLDCPLITRDPAIFAGVDARVETIWD